MTTRPTPLLLVAACAVLVLFSACSAPPRVPQWQNTGGPAGQDVTALLVEGLDGEMLTAGLSTGEVFRSTDGGRTWRRTGAMPARTPIHVIMREPGGSTLYAGASTGLHRSTDDGAAWALLGGPAAGAEVRSLAIDPLDPGMMVMGCTGSGVFRTTDAGGAWTNTLGPDGGGTGPVHDLRISPPNPNIIAASLEKRGVFISTDRGLTWSARTAQLAQSGTVARSIALHPRTPGLICFGTAAGDIYRSAGGGERWTLARQGLRAVPLATLVSPAGDAQTLLTSSEEGLHRSTDWGASWELVPSDLPAIPARLATGGSPRAPVLYAFAPGIGLQRSVDGGRTWQPADRGLGGSTPGVITAGTRSGEMYCTAGPALFVWRPDASSWVTASAGIYGGPLTAVSFDLDGDSIIYVANDAGVFRSLTSGRTWEQMPRSFAPSPVLFFDTHRFIRTRMFLSQEEGVLVSTDRGASWKPIRPFGERARVRRLTYAPASAGIIHAATRSRAVIGSTDGGITWESRRYGIRDSSIAAIARDRDNPRIMYCWNDRGEGYRSTDLGAEWTSWAPPWPAGAAVRITVDRDEPHRVAALVNGNRIYVSETAGAVWTAHTVGDLAAGVESIYWNRREGMLYAGTVDRGVFRIPLADTPMP